MAQRPQSRQPSQQQGARRDLIIFDNLPGMNTRVMRQNLAEKEAAWIENLHPIAGNNLQIVPAPLEPPLTTLPGKTVTRLFHASILTNPLDPNGPLTDYVIFFATDGSGTAVDAASGATTQFAPPGTFSLFPDMTTWSDERILIADSTAGYCSWDGVTFVRGVTSTSGNTIAVAFGRVWIANRRVLTWTGTQGFADTNPANTAGSLTITDADLVHAITALRFLNNYLYIFGDQSIKLIGSVAVQNPPAGQVGQSTLAFTIVTLTSDIGCWYPMTILSYNRIVVFANRHGVYGVMGASVQKLSDDLDGIFENVDWSQYPSAALNDLNDVHCYLLLLRYLDPDNNAVFGVAPQGGVHSRSIIVTLATRNWFVLSQGHDLLAITSAPLQATEEIDTYGSSGPDLTWLLVDDTTPVTWILKTALSAHGNVVMSKQCIRAGLALGALEPQDINFIMESETSFNHYSLFAGRDIIWRNAARDIVRFVNQNGNEIRFKTAPRFAVPYRSADAYGRVLGCTAWSTGKKMAINAALIEYQDADLWGQGPPP